MLKYGHLNVKHGKVRPNAWNPNQMEEVYYAKLKRGLALGLKRGQNLPPIIVRPHKRGKYYEIIDGYHRWKAMGELGEARINVFSMDVDDKQARILTNTMNYLRGRPDRARLGQNIVELLELGSTTDELAELLPESREDLDMLLQEADVSIEALAALHGEEGEDADLLDSKHEDAFVELKFKVSLEQSEVIEAEIKRLGDKLKGKNVRGRALEYMAAASSQTVHHEVE